MKRKFVSLVIALSLLHAIPPGTTVQAEAPEQAPKLEQLKSRVLDFEGSLSAEQRDQLNQPLDWDDWTQWTYFAGRRPGLAIKKLNDSERAKLEKVLKTALSATGYEKAETIRSLETVLGDDPGLYFLAVYGDPSQNDPWALRWAGHHVVFNWVVKEDHIVASTPQFLGASPARVEEGAMSGTRPLGDVEDLGRNLARSLSDSQQQQAILSGQPPRDVLSKRKVQIEPYKPKGIDYAQLNQSQQKLLDRLIKRYAQIQDESIAKARLEKAQRERQQTHFAWIGGTGKTDKHYYRIQGESFVIEYENARPGTNHVHTVWRDFEGDFGRNVLLQHLKTHHDEP